MLAGPTPGADYYRAGARPSTRRGVTSAANCLRAASDFSTSRASRHPVRASVAIVHTPLTPQNQGLTIRRVYRYRVKNGLKEGLQSIFVTLILL